jgi:hypothetical protein
MRVHRMMLLSMASAKLEALNDAGRWTVRSQWHLRGERALFHDDSAGVGQMRLTRELDRHNVVPASGVS